MALIALVEEEDGLRDLLASGLRRSGHSVIPFHDRGRSVTTLRESVDVVITDLILPHADGLERLCELRDRQPLAACIVITSYVERETAIAALNLGTDYLLEKPFPVHVLARVVQCVLSRGWSDGNVEQLFARQLATLPINERERRLVQLVLKGLRNVRIAAQLGITEQAVKSALHATYRKLAIRSRGELFHRVFPI